MKRKLNQIFNYIFVSVIAGTSFVMIAPVAFAADGDVSIVTLKDSNSNGKVNYIELTVAYANAGGGGAACSNGGAGIAHVTDAATSRAAFTITDGTSGNPVSINTAGASFIVSASTAGVSCTVRIILDETDVDLSVNTSATAQNVVYTGGQLRVTNGANPQTIAAFDMVETDAASPIVTAADFKTTTILGIAYNSIQITYSEAIEVSTDAGGDADIVNNSSGASSATLGAMTAAKTLAGIGSWDGASDLTTSSATGNSVALTTNSTVLTVAFNTSASSYFNAGSTAPTTPTFTPTADATDISDVAGNAVNTATVTATNTVAWDATKPTITSVTVDDADSDAKIETATIVFNSSVIDGSLTNANGSLGSGGSTGCTFTTGNTADDATVVCTRTDDATIGTTSSDGDFIYSGATTLIRDHAGNLLDTTTDGTIVTADVNETDGANPILMSAEMGTTSNQNTISLEYSEPMFVNLNPGVNQTIDDGTDIDGTADDDTTTSTANFGNIDAAGSIETFGNFSTAGTVTQSASVNNTVAVSGDGLIVTITLNSIAKSYFTNSATGPSGTFTPDADTTNYILAQASGAIADRRVSTDTGRTVTGSWDLTGPSTPVSFAKQEAVSDTSDKFTWSSVGNADFEEYILFYDTASISLTSGASEWTRTNDATLATRTTETTTVTGLTGNTAYFYRMGAIDKAGNVSLSSQLSETAGEDLGGGNNSDNVAPNPPTEFKAVVNTDLDVVLTWIDPTASDLKEIQIQKSVEGGSFVTLALVNKGAKTYLDTSVEKGKKYSYRLFASDLVGNKSVSTSDVEITVEEGATATVEDATSLVEEKEVDTSIEEDNSVTTTTDSGTEITLKDIVSHWAYNQILALVEKGVVKGNPDGTFKPDNNLNRAEAATLLFRVLGMDEEEMSAPEEKPFSDVAVDSWYAIYVDTLKGLEVIKGNPDGSYKPGMNINRAEFLTLAMNAYYYMMAEEMGEVAVTDAFSDLDKNAWYAKTVSAAFEMKFISGSACGEKKCFNAGSNITRAEATVMLYNIFYKEVSVDNTMPAEGGEDTEETEVN